MTLWNQGVEFIFIDESSANPWRKQLKLWMNLREPFQLNLTPNRGEEKGSVTMLGAISSK